MQHTPVFKVTLLAQRIVLGNIIVHIRVIVILVSTQRNVLGILIIVTQRIVLGILIVNTAIAAIVIIVLIIHILITQRIVLGILIVTIAIVAILIMVSVPNIGLGITTQGIVAGIVTIIGSTAPGNIIIVLGMLGIPTTCLVDTTTVTTTPTNSTAIGRPTTLAISSVTQWISTPETTTSAERT